MSTLIWWLGKKATAIYAVLALSYMMLPIVIVIALSFNKPPGRQNTQFSEFSFDAWTNICRDPTICGAVGESIRIALIATLAATILGTMIAFALVRHHFRGRTLQTY
jgi:spermidine/putrescine transport system permease protein